MPRKKSSSKTAADTPSPTLVNGIRDQEAAEALAPAGVEKRAKPVKSPKTKKAKKPKKEKVVHPKANMTFRRNVLPAMLGILLGAGVLGLLNGQWLVAQYQYKFMKPAAEIAYSTAPASADPNTGPRLYIPRINVSAPVVTDTRTYDPGAVQLALRRGVVQYGRASADPGQKGNLVLIGHSSGQLWAPGDYKFIFTLLDKLSKDDRLIVDFKGTRYIYRVSESKIVPPTDLSVLQPSNEPLLTLITCTPVGTSKNRLIIKARQVSPKPETATAMDLQKTTPAAGIVIPN